MKKGHKKLKSQISAFTFLSFFFPPYFYLFIHLFLLFFFSFSTFDLDMMVTNVQPRPVSLRTTWWGFCLGVSLILGKASAEVLIYILNYLYIYRFLF